jgi:hypothetical protein
MNALLERLSINFVIAAFIPSLAFTLVATVIFDPIIPQSIKDRFPVTFASADDVSTGVLVLFVFTLVVGFTLSSLNTFIYKIIEGYFVLNRIPFVRDRHRKKAQHLFNRITKLETILTKLHQADVPREKRMFLEMHLSDLKTKYQLNYHPDYRLALPTRFGNIFRSAESYSGDRYKIDSILMWPRLIHVIHPSYFSKLEQSNNGLAFLINCMALSFFLSLSCFFASGYQFIMRYLAIQKIQTFLFFFEVSQKDIGIYPQRGWFYLLMGVLIIGVGIFFYNATIPAARQYGGLVRSSFDLFRFELVKQLRLKLPMDSDEEHDLWVKWTKFVALGSLAGEYMPVIDYIHDQSVEIASQDNSLEGK